MNERSSDTEMGYEPKKPSTHEKISVGKPLAARLVFNFFLWQSLEDILSRKWVLAYFDGPLWKIDLAYLYDYIVRK
jgi:hypothetical protein